MQCVPYNFNIHISPLVSAIKQHLTLAGQNMNCTNHYIPNPSHFFNRSTRELWVKAGQSIEGFPIDANSRDLRLEILNTARNVDPQKS